VSAPLVPGKKSRSRHPVPGFFFIRASRKRKRLAGKSVVRVRRRSTFGVVLPRKGKKKKKAEMRVDLTAHANSKIEKSNEHQRTLEKKKGSLAAVTRPPPISLQTLFSSPARRRIFRGCAWQQLSKQTSRSWANDGASNAD
jgi:hypothetical protein